MITADYTYLVDWDGEGSLSLKLDYSSAMFSPDNESSPLYGLIVPFLRVRLLMSIGGTPACMFTGFMEATDPTVGLPAVVSTASLKAYGVIARIQDEEARMTLASDFAKASSDKAQKWHTRFFMEVADRCARDGIVFENDLFNELVS